MASHGAAALGAGGSLLGGIIGNIFSAREASKNRSFQREMRNTAYQAAAEDLEKSGLNRILALGGPAAQPAGSMAQQKDPITPAIHSALAAKLQKAQIIALEAGALKTGAETTNIIAEGHKKGFFGRMWDQISQNLDTTLEGIHSAKGIADRKQRGVIRQQKQKYDDMNEEQKRKERQKYYNRKKMNVKALKKTDKRYKK